jgi:type II secretion system protein G
MKACQRSAFTLIELLIVVAIIAILAAIAVPNFLEAQIRARVSRAKSDMRSIGIAWEAYHVDWNSYPRDQDNLLSHATQYGLRQVTTPVAYITSAPFDPFFANWQVAVGDDRWAPNYEIASATVYSEPYDCYCIMSLGPDQTDNTNGNDAWPNGGDFRGYDPTNGLVSAGEIYRFGGQYLVGQWNYNGLPWQQWGAIGN